MSLKPRNIIQAAQADMKRFVRNAEQAAQSKEFIASYEQYAFHRAHVQRAFHNPRALILLALMDPNIKTAKPNTRLIYGNATLLVEAIRLTAEDQ